MTDLLQSARLFEVSTRLQTASICLERLVKEEALSGSDQNALKWAGKFLVEVDWKSGIGADAGVDGGLAVSATNTRPKFYASLMKIGPEFQKVGIDTEEKVYDFLKGLYKVLLSGGTEASCIDQEQLNLGGELLHVLSQSIIIDLYNNGLPRRKPLLAI